MAIRALTCEMQMQMMMIEYQVMLLVTDINEVAAKNKSNKKCIAILLLVLGVGINKHNFADAVRFVRGLI